MGSLNTRVGLGGSDFPELIVPTVIASTRDFRFRKRVVPALDNLVTDFTPQAHFHGNRAMDYHELLDLDYIMRPAARDAKKLEQFLDHVFAEMKVDVSAHPVVFITPAVFEKEWKATVQRIFFETFHVPKIYFISAPFCAIFAMNLTSGVVVSMGERHTSVQSIYRGFPGEQGFFESNVTGQTITRHFQELLKVNPDLYNTTLKEENSRELKEKLVFCTLDPEKAERETGEGSTRHDRKLVLPNGTELLLNKERFLAVEPYFTPIIVNSNADPLPKLVQRSIQSWDRATRGELMDKIVLAGGASTIPGFAERLEAEVRALFPKGVELKVIGVSGRENIAWIGASVACTKGLPARQWILREQWQAGEKTPAAPAPGQQGPEGGCPTDG